MHRNTDLYLQLLRLELVYSVTGLVQGVDLVFRRLRSGQSNTRENACHGNGRYLHCAHSDFLQHR
jgi:hypothetical protein